MINSRILLKQYWGFDDFRLLQEDIINSVLKGNDTLALLPTGGGKSICFQVPALATEGICIVISPLIALMKDQVDHLKRKNIKAVAITSSMSKREIDIALDNCIYGDYKFLYVSPERIGTELFQERLKKMNINLIAVDEAHCISQWGYDFRPHYLKIADLKELVPNVPVLALTATATPEVVKDIQAKLCFKKENVLQKSFERKNVSYVVLYEENKLNRLLKILNKIKGSGIVYVRNRKKAQDISKFLNENMISADFYHAGLDSASRELKQQKWINNQCAVIVCTNAFGMGIDKPDVRFVVHMDLPDCIESYFQEAGRAGRDEKKAYALLLYSNIDKDELNNHFERSFPPIEEIKNIYNALGNYFQIPVGSGNEETCPFDISVFCNNFHFNPITIFSSLKLLEMDNYLSVSEAVYQPSKIQFINKNLIDDFIGPDKKYNDLIKTILRSYSGLFDNPVKIQEQDIAKRSGISINEVKEMLVRLNKLNIINYIPQTSLPQITYLQDRVDLKHLTISKQTYSIRKERAKTRLRSVIKYCETEDTCRGKMLLNYFGEVLDKNCGSCDVCLREQRTILSDDDYEIQSNKISNMLSEGSLEVSTIIQKLQPFPETKALQLIRWMVENEKLKYLSDNSVTIFQ